MAAGPALVCPGAAPLTHQPRHHRAGCCCCCHHHARLLDGGFVCRKRLRRRHPFLIKCAEQRRTLHGRLVHRILLQPVGRLPRNQLNAAAGGGIGDGGDGDGAVGGEEAAAAESRQQASPAAGCTRKGAGQME